MDDQYKTKEQLINELTELRQQMTELEKSEVERKRAEEAVQISHRFLEIANRHTGMNPLLNEFVMEVQKFTQCAAVGIRILDKEGNIPYQGYNGFGQRFYELESPLSIKSDQCMCINVVKGVTDPKVPFYTEGGSFYMKGTTRFLATVSQEEKGQTRNVCNQVGYESVALVPIRLGDRILGLIHVARHSGATKVTVFLREEDRTLFLEVRDNGRGIRENEILDTKSLGLLGMRERALVFGGELWISGEPDKGTTVILKIP